MAEVRKLKLLVLKLQISNESSKVTQIECNLRRVETQKQRLMLDDREIQRRAAELDTLLLAQPDLQAEKAAEVAALKSTKWDLRNSAKMMPEREAWHEAETVQ